MIESGHRMYLGYSTAKAEDLFPTAHVFTRKTQVKKKAREDLRQSLGKDPNNQFGTFSNLKDEDEDRTTSDMTSYRANRDYSGNKSMFGLNPRDPHRPGDVLQEERP